MAVPPQYISLQEYDAIGAGNGVLQEQFTDDERTLEIIAQSEVADSYIGNVEKLPLKSWGNDLGRAVAKLVDYELMGRLSRNRGGPGGDSFLSERRDEALQWLRDIARGNARLLAPTSEDQTPTTYEGGSYVVTRSRRGWGC